MAGDEDKSGFLSSDSEKEENPSANSRKIKIDSQRKKKYKRSDSNLSVCSETVVFCNLGI
jgi:hypothetical protein